ncbi:hypothetical protein ABPG75_000017 [Micractinium tetrahymenae]
MRWEVCFNLCILRMLSYALDLHWHRQSVGMARHAEPGACRAHLEVEAVAPRFREQATCLHDGDYGLLLYLAHVLYGPLYLAGPIVTFQDFTWQLKQRASPVGTAVSLLEQGPVTCRAGRAPWTSHAGLLPK